MTLVAKINDDLKTAMKNHEKEKLNVIRMLKGAIQLKSVELKRELTDEEVIDVVSKQIKMRKDSICQFKDANRDDLVSQYSDEINVLEAYMPKQLSLDEVVDIVDKAFEKINPTSPKQMGIIMKEVTPLVKGKFDMGEVSKLIKEKLSDL